MIKKLLNLEMPSVYDDEDKATLKHNMGILVPIAMLLLVVTLVFI